jgi:HPt (histidine-containing phosphotransfer) domain-containing protein
VSDPVVELMARLRREYLAEVPDRLDQLRFAAGAFQRDQPADPPLATLFHRLAGSAGAYGFGPVTLLCREMEQWLATEPPRDDATMARIEESIRAIASAFRDGPTTEGIA